MFNLIRFGFLKFISLLGSINYRSTYRLHFRIATDVTALNTLMILPPRSTLLLGLQRAYPKFAASQFRNSEFKLAVLNSSIAIGDKNSYYTSLVIHYV